jgi:hypothetical protein
MLKRILQDRWGPHAPRRTTPRWLTPVLLAAALIVPAKVLMGSFFSPAPQGTGFIKNFFTLTTCTAVPRNVSDNGGEIKNYGVTAIWVIDGVNTVDGGGPPIYTDGGLACVAGQGRSIPPNGGYWSFPYQGVVSLWTIAETSSQTGDAGTTYSGAP